MAITLRLQKNKASIQEGSDSMVGKLLSSVTGTITIKTPFGTRVITQVTKE